VEQRELIFILTGAPCAVGIGNPISAIWEMILFHHRQEHFCELRE
jgi:hypothetical protein